MTVKLLFVPCHLSSARTLTSYVIGSVGGGAQDLPSKVLRLHHRVPGHQAERALPLGEKTQ